MLESANRFQLNKGLWTSLLYGLLLLPSKPKLSQAGASEAHKQDQTQALTHSCEDKDTNTALPERLAPKAEVLEGSKKSRYQPFFGNLV